MQIKIAERLRPYSHNPGSVCVLPGSFFKMRIFPALIHIYDLRKSQPSLYAEIPLAISGPVNDFTILQDLEKGFVSVWGKTKKGFMRYRITGVEDKICLGVEKKPVGEELCQTHFDKLVQGPLIPKERLSLGSHKAQDWGLMQRREALEEILPIWFRLGQLSPEMPQEALGGTAILLNECQQKIESKNRLAILPAFQKLRLAGFEGMLSPRLIDDDHQGLNIPPLGQESSLSPLILLTHGARLIRSLFVHQEDNLIRVLPALPPEFHCGRLVGIQCQNLGTLDLEWSKKIIRRMVMHAQCDGELCFKFSEVKSFRLRIGNKDRGARISADQPLKIEKNKHYFIDNFIR